MPVTNVDRLEAILAAVCPADLAVFSPAERRRVADAAYSVHVLAEQAAGGTPFPAVRRAKPKDTAPEGVIGELGRGKNSQ
jgi:hypothetical protein